MKFYNYINNITINLSEDESDVNKLITNRKLIEDTQKIIDDLNNDLNLNRNKKKFKLTDNTNAPFLKNHSQSMVIDKWLDANEKFTTIKKTFFEFLDTCHIK